MRRRRLLALAAGVAAVATTFAAPAQQSRVKIIGVLDGGDPGPLLTEFRRGLRELGYVEGENVQIEVRSAAGNSELLRGLAEELVRRKVDVIVARLTPPARAAKDATQIIPIVMAPARNRVDRQSFSSGRKHYRSFDHKRGSGRQAAAAHARDVPGLAGRHDAGKRGRSDF